jgi:CTP synthase
MKKYIFVTGGVCSSLGKGIAAASLGTLLEARGFRVNMIKIDPYLNVDAGTMSPYQHGEVFVTDDGAETDLDLGNYARFTSSALSQANSITTGQVYQTVIRKEREGRYLGKTVQVIPHITDEIKHQIYRQGEQPNVEITIVEVGGTVGDIESIPFLESARQAFHDKGRGNVLSVHLTLIPRVTDGELKTKPTQHSVKELREIGIQPDVLLCRADVALDEEMRRKIAIFTNVEASAVLSAQDVHSTIYEIPLMYHKEGLDSIVMQKLGLEAPDIDISHWEKVVKTITSAEQTLKIGMVGKYIDLADSYKSVDEALIHGGIANKSKIQIIKIDSEKLEKNPEQLKDLKELDGILIPGGFGSRGVEGMVMTARYARENKIPYLGICLGLQIMVIEYARHVLGLADATSTEFEPEADHPVVSLLEEQIDVSAYGGTMRLGLSPSHLKKSKNIQKAYGEEVIYERHRHRYEVSNKYKEQLEQAGLLISGTTSDGSLVESMEWKDHPWSVGVQFHPEFTSKPTAPHKLFSAFIKASLQRYKKSKN